MVISPVTKMAMADRRAIALCALGRTARSRLAALLVSRAAKCGPSLHYWTILIVRTIVFCAVTVFRGVQTALAGLAGTSP